MSRPLALAELERALALHPAVFDGAVGERVDSKGRPRVVAWVAPALDVSRAELFEALGAAEDVDILPDDIVFVSAIPRTATGAPDREVLDARPVVDTELARAAEALAPGTGDAAAVVTEAVPATLRLHLAEILPSWKRRLAEPGPVGPAHASDREKSARGVRASLVETAAVPAAGDDPRTLAETLRRTAADEDSRDVVYVEPEGETIRTYRALLDEAEGIAGGLRQAGLRDGDRVLLQLDRASDFLPAFWGAVLSGAVPIPFAVPTSYRQPSAVGALRGAYSVTARPFVLTSAALHEELAQAAEEAGLAEFRTGTIESLRNGPRSADHEAEPTDVALMMLTSGSTGLPKAVQLAHANLLTRTRGSRQLNGFDRDEVSLNWMPLDHVAGLIYFHIRDTYLGCRQVQLPTQTVVQSPLAWLDALERYRATITFAPNFAYGLVNEGLEDAPERSWDLSSVRFILNGAEAIVARTAREFLRRLAPHGLSPEAMHPAWGMSETSSGVTYSDRFRLDTTTDDDPFVEVGRPVPGLSMRIVDDAGSVVPEDTIGHLQVRGPVVTRGYFGSPELTEKAFVEDGWFDTGDLGVMREGRLTITGREKDVVVINSVKYYSHAIESEVEDIDGVMTSYTAACAVRDPERNTDQLAIFLAPERLELDALAELMKSVRAQVATRVGVRPTYIVPVTPDRIPKTSLGKIQRPALAQKLLDGEFEEALRLAELATGAESVPDWFFRAVWERRDGAGRRSFASEVWILGDGDGIADALDEHLTGGGGSVVRVSYGSDYERLDARHLRIDPTRAEHYERLVADLGEGCRTVEHVIELGDWRPVTPGASAGSVSAHSLLGLTRALAEVRVDRTPLRITVAAHSTARVEPDDEIAWDRAPPIAWLRSIPQEQPWFRGAHVDLPASTDPTTAANRILDELEIASSPTEPEVAWRGDARYVRRLRRVRLGLEPRGSAASIAAPGAWVLVTGGLGGVGHHVCRHLVSERGLRVLIVGRRSLEEDAEAASALRSLRQLGGQVEYEVADVLDAGALDDAVRRHEAEGNGLRAVVHLAGGYEEALARDQDAVAYERLLAPRVEGLRNVYGLLERRGSGELLLSSSVAGFFGGASLGAYAGASRCLDAFAEHHHGRGPVTVHAFQWSNWEDIGQARRTVNKELPRTKGYLPMSAEEALRSLEVGLAHPGASLLVGLDGANRHVRPYVTDRCEPLEEIRLLRAAADDETADETLELVDRYGTPASVTVAPVHELPRAPDGSLDRDALEALAKRSRTGRADAVAEPPEGETEQGLAEIWKAVLGVAEVARDDSFFELGGDSLSAVRTQSQIRDRFGVELSLRTLFERTRLSELAAGLGLPAEAPAAASEARPGDAPGIDDPEALLARIDDMSDEEVEALLAQVSDEEEGSS